MCESKTCITRFIRYISTIGVVYSNILLSCNHAVTSHYNISDDVHLFDNIQYGSLKLEVASPDTLCQLDVEVSNQDHCPASNPVWNSSRRPFLFSLFNDSRPFVAKSVGVLNIAVGSGHISILLPIGLRICLYYYHSGDMEVNSIPELDLIIFIKKWNRN